MQEREFATERDLERAGIAKRQTLAKWRVERKGPDWYKLQPNGAVRYRWCDIEKWLKACARSGQTAA
jgi:hypothetical protein